MWSSKSKVPADKVTKSLNVESQKSRVPEKLERITPSVRAELGAHFRQIYRLRGKMTSDGGRVYEMEFRVYIIISLRVYCICWALYLIFNMDDLVAQICHDR